MQKLDEFEKQLNKCITGSGKSAAQTTLALIKTIRAQHEVIKSACQYYNQTMPDHIDYDEPEYQLWKSLENMMKQTEKDWGDFDRISNEHIKMEKALEEIISCEDNDYDGKLAGFSMSDHFINIAKKAIK